MKKHPYRAASVKSIDGAELRSEMPDGPCVVGIDVAKEHFVAALSDRQGTVRKTLRWRHPDETPDFLLLLQALDATRVEVVLESTSTYGDALVHGLQKGGIASVFEVHTKHARDARELFDGVPSQHDGKCAAIIALLHAQGRSHPRRVMSGEQRAVRALLDSRKLYREQLEVCRGRLEALLARYWPEAGRVVALDSAALLVLLATYGSAQAVAAHAGDAYALMVKTGGPSLKSDKVRALVQSAATTLGMVPIAEEVQALKQLVREMQRCQSELQRLQKQFKQCCQANAELAAMARVVGAMTALALFGLLGSPQQYGSAGAWLKAAGMNLKEHSSGRDPKSDRHVPVSLSKRGPPEVRRLLFLASLRLAQFEPTVALWLASKARRDGGSKMKGQVAIMRKLMRALWHIGRAAAEAQTSSGERREQLEQDAVFRAERLYKVAATPTAQGQAA